MNNNGTNGVQNEATQARERAEVLVDRAGMQIGHFAALVGYQLRRVVARTREEAEDILAEAQHIRRGDQR